MSAAHGLALGMLTELARRADEYGAQFLRYTRPQRLFLSDPFPVVLWRDGNQLGKSTALAVEVISTARGIHPFRILPRKPPARIIVIGESLEQMEPLMAKLWALCPKHELADSCGFEAGRGITGKPPRLVFVRGPGAGSVVVFATYRQGPRRVAGSTLDLAVMDEPPTAEMYGEVVPRVLKLRGLVRIGFTPVPDMPDMGWLRDKIKAGQIREHNYELREENCWVEGHPTPFYSAARIAEYESTLLDIEKDMRTKGAWEPVVTGRWLSGFDKINILDEPVPEGAWWGVGIDHGARAGRQYAALVAFHYRDTERPRVRIVDEYQASGTTSVDEDAAGILAMLARQGVAPEAVDRWIGDRVTRATRGDAEKSNRLLRIEMARILKKKISDLRAISVPYKFRGSVVYGMRLMNTLFLRQDEGVPALTVHPRCERFIEAVTKFCGAKEDRHKDPVDAARYIIETSLQTKIVGRPRT